MAAWLERLGWFARAPDARPVNEIRADIDAELAFHVEEATREEIARGRDPEQAHAEALRRFGDVERVRRECAWTQLGERIVMQRVQVLLTAVLIAAVGLLLWSNRTARAALEVERQTHATLLARIETRLDALAPTANAVAVTPSPVSGPGRARVDSAAGHLNPEGVAVTFEEAVLAWHAEFAARGTTWRRGLELVGRLAALPGSQGVEILARVYPALHTEVREQVAKPFVFDGGRPDVLEVLELGVRDPEPSVRERAFQYLRRYAFVDLGFGESAAESWFAAWRDRPVDEVLRENAARWARALGAAITTTEDLSSASLSDELEIVDAVDLAALEKNGIRLGEILRTAGVERITPAQIASLDPESSRRAAQLAAWSSLR